jgi:SAM-dependent methyltransferase
VKPVSTVDLVEAHFLTHVLDALHQTGALRLLVTPQPADRLAATLGVDSAILEPLLVFAALRSDVIDQARDGRFQLAGDGAGLGRVEHLLDQYIGGYGPPLRTLAALMAGHAAAPVDLTRHAAAFATKPGDLATLNEAGQLIQGFGATRIVELGCGGGQALVALALANPDLSALGIDANPAAADAALTFAASLGVADRVEIGCGDGLALLAGRADLAGFQIVLAASVLNALWAQDLLVAGFLRQLGGLLPGRIMVISDYYSHLGRPSHQATPRTLIHDLAQLLSGQGVPPPDRVRWQKAYQAAGAELIEVMEAAGDGIDRFIHLIKLPG